MKLIAKQVPPEQQESPLFHAGFFPEDIAVFGNRHYNQHIPDIVQRVIDALYSGELLYYWEEMQNGNEFYSNWAESLEEIVPPENRPAYTRHERKNVWPDLIQRFTKCRSSEENALYCEALQLMTGEQWDHTTIRGSGQSDWQNVIFPVNRWSRRALEGFEIEYFNEGSEWIIDPEENSYTMYCTEWSDAGIKKEIADAHGCSPDEITLLKFTGWTRTAEYEEV